MIDRQALHAALRDIGCENWMDTFAGLLDERLSSSYHGDFARWEEALSAIRNHESKETLKTALLELSPWRKGPFSVGGIDIDAEWQSNLKWERIKASIDLDGRSVLDVGSGNGYYALRMREAGARVVIGIDPTILYVMQFLAVNQFENDTNAYVLPARLEEMPDANSFDTTFSMGVLYHQRSPIDHLRQLRRTLRPNGQLVLETIFVPGEESYACTPEDRYARMKNVWLLPTIAELTTWLNRSGYRDINIIDQSLTTTDEQRSTEWMSFESLAEALDPNDAGRTVEGWPAPRRVVVTATSP